MYFIKVFLIFFPFFLLYFSLSFFLTPVAESIQSNPGVFLEGDKSQGGPASQPSPETKAEGGGRGREESDRRDSVTSIENEMSVCSKSQLRNTIANSEWEGNSHKKKTSVHGFFFFFFFLLRSVYGAWNLNGSQIAPCVFNYVCYHLSFQ